MPIAGSSYFSILPNPFLHPTTKLKGLLPLAGTHPGHSHFNQFVFTTLPNPFFRPTTKLKGRQPQPDRGHLILQTACTYYLTTVPIADSSYCFIPPNPFFRRTTKLKGRQPLAGTDPGHLRLQTPCSYHLTTVAIADSSYFSILPIPFLHPATKLKGLQPPAGTDPGHLDFKHLALTTWPLWQLLILLFYSA